MIHSVSLLCFSLGLLGFLSLLDLDEFLLWLSDELVVESHDDSPKDDEDGHDVKGLHWSTHC